MHNLRPAVHDFKFKIYLAKKLKYKQVSVHDHNVKFNYSKFELMLN